MSDLVPELGGDHVPDSDDIACTASRETAAPAVQTSGLFMARHHQVRVPAVFAALVQRLQIPAAYFTLYRETAAR